MPNLEPYLRLLEPEMLLEKQKNEIKRHEAWRVYGALLVRFVSNGFVMLSSMRSPKMGYMLHVTRTCFFYSFFLACDRSIYI